MLLIAMWVYANFSTSRTYKMMESLSVPVFFANILLGDTNMICSNCSSIFFTTNVSCYTGDILFLL